MAKLKPKKKQQQIIFDSMQDFNKAVNIQFNRLMKEEIHKYQGRYEKAIEQAKIDAAKHVASLLVPLVINAMYEAYGIGPKRAEKFIEYFNRHIECVNEGVLNYNDYENWCKEMGYKFIKMEDEDEK